MELVDIEKSDKLKKDIIEDTKDFWEGVESIRGSKKK